MNYDATIDYFAIFLQGMIYKLVILQDTQIKKNASYDLFNALPSIEYVNPMRFLTLSTAHLSLLNDSCQFRDHADTELRSSWRRTQISV